MNNEKFIYLTTPLSSISIGGVYLSVNVDINRPDPPVTAKRLNLKIIKSQILFRIHHSIQLGPGPSPRGKMCEAHRFKAATNLVLHNSLFKARSSFKEP